MTQVMTQILPQVAVDAYAVCQDDEIQALVRWPDGARTFVIRLAPCDVSMLDDDSAPVLDCDGTYAGMRRAAIHFCNNEELVYDSKEIQLQLDNMPKKRGRPTTGTALTGAQRAKRARDKKRRTALVTINKSLGDEQSARYNKMLELGLDLDAIVDLAAAVLADVEFKNRFSRDAHHVTRAMDALNIEYITRDK